MINQLSQKILAINIKNGFYEGEKNIGEMLCLIHSEVSEALECDRNNLYCKNNDIDEENDQVFNQAFTEQVKDTFEDELADIMIRVMDLAAYKKVDLEKHINLKMRYNSLRVYKHGKKY
jgi:NTP pyrophosphatase (non-canonical NTP hydrolase)